MQYLIGIFITLRRSRMLAELKKTKEWLKEVSSVALQQSLRHLETAFERFFQKKGSFPKFKKRSYEQKATFMKNAFTFKNGELWLAKCAEPLKIRWSRRFQGEPSSITLTLDQRGHLRILIFSNLSSRRAISSFIMEIPRPIPGPFSI
jgi:putative transposase